MEQKREEGKREEDRRDEKKREERRRGRGGRRRGDKVLVFCFLIQIFSKLEFCFFLLSILNFACNQMHLGLSLRFIPLFLV